VGPFGKDSTDRANSPGDIERSIFGNIATLISFQISAEDAGTLRREMRGSKYAWRNRKRGGDWRPISDAIENEIAFRKREGVEYYKKRIKDAQASNNQEHENEIRRWHGLIQETMTAIDELSDPHTPLSTILRMIDREEREIHQIPFPDPDDFINMQARYAFCRMERADNVTAFRTVAPPDPTPGTRGQILNAMRERHADRKKAQPPPRPQQPRPAREEPKRKTKARILKTPDVKKPPKSKNKSTGELSF